MSTNRHHSHDDEFHRLEQEAVDANLAWLDNTEGTTTARWSRHLAERTGRRSMLARIGKTVVGLTGAAMIPALPVRRVGAQQEEEEETIDFTGTDPTDCNYWRYCNLGGRLCADCEGGGITTCPPGTVLGVEYWVGCCTDPTSGRTYLTANYDCCGKSGCGGRCGEPWQQDTPPDYAPGSTDRNVLWCMSDPTQSYTCTIVPLIGENCQARPAPQTRAEFESQRSGS